MAKAEARRDAKTWLSGLCRDEALAVTAQFSGGLERGNLVKARRPFEIAVALPTGGDNDRPYASPHFWAALVLTGEPN